MPRTKGTKQLFAEITDALLDGFKEFCEARGETVRENLEMAIRRHMANPPPTATPALPPPLVPLPPVAPDVESVAKKPAAKRGKK